MREFLPFGGRLGVRRGGGGCFFGGRVEGCGFVGFVWVRETIAPAAEDFEFSHACPGEVDTGAWDEGVAFVAVDDGGYPLCYAFVVAAADCDGCLGAESALRVAPVNDGAGAAFVAGGCFAWSWGAG